MRNGAERHLKKMLQPLPAGLGLLNKKTGPNLFVPDRHPIDVEKIRIDVKFISIYARRSLFNINQIQLNVERFYIDVKGIEIAAERKISAVERRFCDAERRFCDAERRFCDAERRFCDMERRFCDAERRFCDAERKFCDGDRRFCDVERKISAVKVLDFDIHQKITCTHRWLFDKYENPMEFQEKFFTLNREYSDLPL